MFKGNLFVISIYLIFLIVNCILCSKKKEHKGLAFISWAFLMIFVAGKRYNGSYIAYDLGNYLFSYERTESINGVYEPLYNFLSFSIKKIGFDFYGFYAIIVIIIMISIFYIARKNQCNLHYYIVPYMIYFALIDMDQLRNQLALVFLLYGLFILVQQKAHFKIKYCICVLLASMFHASFIAYLIFLVGTWKNKKMIVTLSVLFSLTFSLVTYFYGGSWLTSILSLIFDGKFYQYIDTRVGLGFVIPLLAHLISIYLVHYCYKVGVANQLEASDIKMFQLTRQIQLISCVFYPLLFMNVTMYRLNRNIAVFSILVASTLIKKSNKKQRLKITALIALIAIGYFIFDIVIKGYWQSYCDNFFLIYQ